MRLAILLISAAAAAAATRVAPPSSYGALPPLTRRRLASSLAALPGLLAVPEITHAFRLPDLMAGVAGPGGVQMFGPSGELGRLAESLAQLQDLSNKLEQGVYKADDDDSIVVLKLSAIYFKSTPGLMNVATEAMDELTPAEVTEVQRLASEYGAAVAELEEGCRARDLARQKAGCAQASGLMTKYLAVAAQHYTVPAVRISM